MNPPLEIAELKRLSRTELQQCWRETIGGKSLPQVKLVLLRDLAWHAQESIRGGLDSPTQTLLRAAIRQHEFRPDVDTRQSKRVRSPRSKRARPKPQLCSGTKLIRTWRGKTYEVTVIESDKKFTFRGQTYSSLTQIAQEITGAHWSGPRFFGINRIRGIQ